MPIDWIHVNKALSPIKDYEELSKRLQGSFKYPFVCKNYNFALPGLFSYTKRFLGGDARGPSLGFDRKTLLSSIRFIPCMSGYRI